MSNQRTSFICFLGATGTLALNIFLLSPLVSERFGNFVGNNTYISVRILTVLVFSVLMTWLGKGQRTGVIRSATLLILLDQILFKALYLLRQFKIDPSSWEGIDHTGVLFSLVMSYIMTLPFIILVSFVGTEIGNAIEKKVLLKQGLIN